MTRCIDTAGRVALEARARRLRRVATDSPHERVRPEGPIAPAGAAGPETSR